MAAQFDPDASYTRQEISEALGGIGPGILAARYGEIVCGLFDTFTNSVTHLTGEIDAYAKTAPKAAKSSIGKSFPAFVRKSTEYWRYVGEYKLEEVAKGKVAAAEAKKEIGRDDAAVAMKLKPANAKKPK